MRILFCIPSLSSGGAERVMSILVNYMAKKRYQITLIYFSTEIPHYRIDSKVKVINGFRPQKSLPIIRPIFALVNIYKCLVKELNQNGYDLVVSFLPFVNLAAILAARKKNVPVIISERSNPLLTTNGLVINNLRRLFYSKANCCVLQTTQVKQAFENMRISLPLVEVIPNPIDESFFLEEPNSQRDNVILSVGRLSEEKGHELLIKAIGLLKKRFDLQANNWKVQIVGDGILKNDLQARIKELELTQIVELVGQKKDVRLYYQKSKIFVLPSKTEGFPNALLEAMSASCACISLDCNFGPSEIIENGVSGLLVPINNKEELSNQILNVITDQVFQNTLQANAKIRSLDFHQDVIMHHWIELFERVMR